VLQNRVVLARIVRSGAKSSLENGSAVIECESPPAIATVIFVTYEKDDCLGNLGTGRTRLAFAHLKSDGCWSLYSGDQREEDCETRGIEL
jgi:hypothetical protein